MSNDCTFRTIHKDNAVSNVKRYEIILFVIFSFKINNGQGTCSRVVNDESPLVDIKESNDAVIQGWP